jgi:hypothetical protein
VIGKRGLVVLALLATAALAGYAAGGSKERVRWSGWTHNQVAVEWKGARRAE